MPSLIEETGNRHGRLVVLEEVSERTKDGCVCWLCQCDCGNNCIVPGKRLRSGDTSSCGCLHHDMLVLPPGQANFNRLYNTYKLNAKRRNLVFELTKEDFSFITKMNCHYCGGEPSSIMATPWGNGDYIYTGIDRIDNSGGYTIDNVVPCCWNCNDMKGEKSVSDFLEHIKKIYNRSKRWL